MKKNIVIFILALGVFSIINTEMGIVGILPLVSSHYNVSIMSAGLMVSLFALVVAVSGPTMPLLCSKMDRKKAMILVLSVFTICNIIAACTSNFMIALLVRIVPAIFHPIYISIALTVASTTVDEAQAPKAVSKVLVGVSAGMVLGVPIISFVANQTSITVAMLSFALVNAIALIATILFMPAQPVSERMSYGTQIRFLKYPIVWISILAVILLNGSIFGVFSFFTEYLATITHMSDNVISVMLLIYGLANMVGTVIGGKQLSNRPNQFIKIFPFMLVIVYFVLFMFGSLSIPMAIFTLIWGILAGAAGNFNQYWITSIMKEAPEFGNGLFLAATNLGTSIGTTLCGFIISRVGISYMVVGGIILLSCSIIMIFCRVIKVHKNEQIRLQN